jgi:RHS repeat-associated protein
VNRKYDSDFRLSSLTVNSEDPIGFAYDADGLLISAGDLALSRNPDTGLITGTKLDGVTDSFEYNAFGELTAYTAAYQGSELFAARYARDALGRVTRKTETIAGMAETYDYTYDPAGRLSSVKRNGTTVTYEYDANGNQLKVAGPSGGFGRYDAQDRLLDFGGTYTYTANGELASKTVRGATTTYNYDVLGNLLDVTLPNGTAITYLVNGQNRRIGKKVNGALVQGFLYQDGLRPVAELDGSGGVVSRFVYASRSNVPDYLIKEGSVYRIIADHLGSPRLVINVMTSEIAQRLDYSAFGAVLRDTNPGFQPFGFAGGLYDRDTGLVRFGARDFDAETGRWTAKDPILFAGGSSNLYAYAENDPVNFFDPDGKGHFTWLKTLAVIETLLTGRPRASSLIAKQREAAEKAQLIRKEKKKKKHEEDDDDDDDVGEGLTGQDAVCIDPEAEAKRWIIDTRKKVPFGDEIHQFIKEWGKSMDDQANTPFNGLQSVPSIVGPMPVPVFVP